jgi:4-hydroxy-tetrahydrodipicolinate synthase
MAPSKLLPRGIVASSMTPFDRAGRVDRRAIAPHIDWLIGEGVAGLSPLGSAGEFFAMESADRKMVIEAVVEANRGRVPIMAGTHHYDTAITIDLSRHAEQAGADALLIVPPYYAGPTSMAVMDHYRRVADAVSIPVVMYHNSVSTGVDLSTEMVRTLFEEGAIGGVKFSNMLPDRLVELMQATEGKLPVYAGIDFVAFEALCHGGYGWISGIPSIVPRAANRLYQTIARDGDLPAARAQWRLLAPLMRFIFETRSNPVNGAHWLGIMKAALNMIGPAVGDPLPPSGKINAAQQQKLAGLLRALGYTVADHAGQSKIPA